ncbi:MAG TPA: hypothetical protein VNN08_09790 [Thermoanaerobaculia bacterium]|nr:hypothetical protein [Thermoanaerobaculia bacterium]
MPPKTEVPMSLIGRIWRRLKQAYVFVLPLRFNLLALAMLLFAFRFSDQGQDILRALTERNSDRRLHDIGLFIVLTNLLAFEAWFWSRHLLRYRPGIDPENHDPMRDPLPSDPGLEGLTTWLPRLMGLAVYLIEIVGFVYVGGTRKWIFILLVVSAVVYMLFVVTRRKIFDVKASPTKRADVFRDFDLVTRAMFIGAIVVELVLFAWATVAPVTWNQLGVAATLVLTIAVWMPIGTLLIGIGEKVRFPILSGMLVWALVIGRCADNHDIRVSKPLDPQSRKTLTAAFTTWYERMNARYPVGRPIPVIIVATEGGGIRAAYWTATALTAVTDAVPEFADHCFAISGVSGGSLGALMYDAILARRLDAHPGALTVADAVRGAHLQEDVHRVLQYDALSGNLASLAQPDLTQRFVPVALFKLPDRERGLEEGWEAGWDNNFHDGLFAKPFVDTLTSHPLLPNLFLNGTVVETGERIITSNLRLDQELFFRNTFDALKEMRADLPMSSAAGMSARFTYVSPAGKIPYTRDDCKQGRKSIPCSTGSVENRNCGRDLFGHVVDGGYFENSGAVTAAEVVAFVNERAKLGDRVVPFVIVIDHWNEMTGENCPVNPRPRLFCPAPGRCGPPVPPTVERFANEVLSPLRGVLNARDARGKEAVGDLAQVMRDAMIEIRLAPRATTDTALPLGWILSDTAMKTIDNGLTAQSGNLAAIDALRSLFATGTRPPVACDNAQCGDANAEKGSGYGK